MELFIYLFKSLLQICFFRRRLLMNLFFGWNQCAVCVLFFAHNSDVKGFRRTIFLFSFSCIESSIDFCSIFGRCHSLLISCDCFFGGLCPCEAICAYWHGFKNKTTVPLTLSLFVGLGLFEFLVVFRRMLPNSIPSSFSPLFPSCFIDLD